MNQRYLICLFIFGLTGCIKYQPKVLVDYNSMSMSVSDTDFVISYFYVYNDYGKGLLNSTLSSGSGYSKMYFFTPCLGYVTKGTIEDIRKDTSQKNIRVLIKPRNSDDSNDIIVFDANFNLKSKGIAYLKDSGEPFP